MAPSSTSGNFLNSVLREKLNFFLMKFLFSILQLKNCFFDKKDLSNWEGKKNKKKTAIFKNFLFLYVYILVNVMLVVSEIVKMLIDKEKKFKKKQQ